MEENARRSGEQVSAFVREVAGGHDGSCPHPCPICAAITLLQEVRPEVTEHLLTAAREVMLAAKAFLEQTPPDRRKAQPPIEPIGFD